jgi:hypothetical protein
MRHILLLLLVVAGSIALSAQTAETPVTPPPQTARQALIEMFMGKGADDFAKHLPEDARRALIHQGESPETTAVLRIAAIGRQMTTQGEHTETFDVGPNILVTQERNGLDKIEVAVEHDSLLGEEDEIELSVHVYKDGQLQSLPVIPRLIFTMKSEKEIWRLTEVTVAGHIPLTDPDYLKGLRKEQDEANESAAQVRMAIIAAAETSYAANHPDRGYACTLSTLFAPNSVPPSSGTEGFAVVPPVSGFYDPGQGSDEYNGYRYAITDCDGNPVTKYRITAAPSDPDAPTKIFCADESGAVKSAATRTGSSCLSEGQVINPGTPATPIEE